jgi:hypothetical protein
LIVLDSASLPAAEASARLTPLLEQWIETEDGSRLMLFRAESLNPERLLDEDELPVSAEV